MNLGDVGTLGSCRIIQVMSSDQLLVADASQTFIIEGLPTVGMVDNRNVSGGDRAFLVDRTTNYTSVLGANKTVFVVKVLPTEEADALLLEVREIESRQAAAEVERENEGKLMAQELRTWTGADGKFTAKARFVSIADGMVTLRTKDESDVEVPLKTLSDEDQLYIRSGGYRRPVDE